MAFCEIYHITVTAPDLRSGAAHVQSLLGVTAEMGGEHPGMGTHTMLLRLGPTLFLEIIAVNPLAAKPDWPRWFALDELHPDSKPALSNWVARTQDISAMQTQASEHLGQIEPMSRGNNHWLITIPADGSLPMQGIAPSLIEWHTERHPASGLPELGLSLLKMELYHPDPARISRLFQSLDMRGEIEVKAISERQLPHMIAYIQTPHGIRILS